MSMSNGPLPDPPAAQSPGDELRPRRRTPPGAAPGTLVADPHAPRPHIRLFSFGPDRFSEDEIVGVESLPARIDKDGVNWIDIAGLGDAEVIRRLGEMFGLHRLALEDVLHVHQRPKVEEYGDQLFVVFRTLDLKAREPSEQVSLFLLPGLVITFQERPGDCFDHVRNRIRHGRGAIRALGADYLTYALLDAVIDHYFPVLEAYDDRLDDLTEMALRFPHESIARDLHRVKRELFNLRRIIWASRELVNNLMRADVPVLQPATLPYLRDCYDHCVQLMDMLEMQHEVASNLFNTYLSSLSQRANEIMKVLTVIATIFIPLSFVASLYGMNFDSKASPWNMPELHWAFGYPAVLALMAAIAGGLLLWFRRRGWIGRGRDRRRPVRRGSRRAR
ncbi:MAG: magnesium/cobalt transporter CorA [Pseudomonadota bacterium]